MTSPGTSQLSHRLDETIRALCLVVEQRLRDQAARSWCAYDLRRELIACVLGSQVRYEMAIDATQNLAHAGLLDDVWWSNWSYDAFPQLVFEVLSGQRADVPNRGAYRFAKTRADQLALIRQALSTVPLSTRIAECEDPKEFR